VNLLSVMAVCKTSKAEYLLDITDITRRYSYKLYTITAPKA